MFFQKTLDFYIVSSFLLNVKKQTKISSDSCLLIFQLIMLLSLHTLILVYQRLEMKSSYFIEFVQDILYML